MFKKVSQMPTPKACLGCDHPPQQPSSARQQVEAATGVRVWSVTSYADGRLPVMEDMFRNKVAESVVAVAVRGYEDDTVRFNEELAACPGQQEGQVCGRLALTVASEASD